MYTLSKFLFAASVISLPSVYTLLIKISSAFGGLIFNYKRSISPPVGQKAYSAGITLCQLYIGVRSPFFTIFCVGRGIKDGFMYTTLHTNVTKLVNVYNLFMFARWIICKGTVNKYSKRQNAFRFGVYCAGFWPLKAAYFLTKSGRIRRRHYSKRNYLFRLL